MTNIHRLLLLCSIIFIVSCNNTPEETTDQTDSTTAPQEEVVTDEAMADDIPDEIDENPYEGFVPSGYTLYNAFRGDLNRDDYEDALIVLEPIDDPDNMTSRAVALLLGDAEGKLTQAAYCKNAMLCKECGGTFGDPFSDVVIKNGYFTLEHYGGSSYRWTHDPTFKYVKAKKNWYLHQVSVQEHTTFDPENSHKSTITTPKDFGEVAFEDFMIVN